ncbi:RNA polymerase sigma factor [Aeromicrobium sp. UC242_57]|uniref:RNA polymerase sigma factor n=1 Tax=Aeromicrobium sp. UC242_57 TaxID=3374624 RepID=UPI00379C406B
MFDLFYARTAPAVARFAWSLSASREAVEELLQDTFLTAWSRPGAVRVINDSALPWLLVTCRNHARNRARRDQRWNEMIQLEESLTADAADTAAAVQLQWALSSITNLPDTDRVVCEPVLLQGFSDREAAGRLRISEASVGKRLSRSRKILRREVQE